jgi:hypothetical protein
MYTSLFLTAVAGMIVMGLSNRFKPQYQTPYIKGLCLSLGALMILISVVTALWLFARNS